MTIYARHPLQGGLVPAWAVEWGEDRHGAFATFALGASDGPPEKLIEQRMRWIPPGTFRMGSPETERGRFEDEGPQHEVTLVRGYWLGDTPVTQALWIAVMGENPSHFRGDRPDDLQRPVDHVDFETCQAFLDRLNVRVPGLAARLPTEAEWERACRAGTTAATWVGELSAATRAPELDAIAWYSGNSGGESHPVRRKAPNPYGLYDMLGNVWEWCADKMRAYEAKPVMDPAGTGQDPPWVGRGGSWHGDARLVRAACREMLDRTLHYGPCGFRLAGGGEAPARPSRPNKLIAQQFRRTINVARPPMVGRATAAIPAATTAAPAAPRTVAPSSSPPMHPTSSSNPASSSSPPARTMPEAPSTIATHVALPEANPTSGAVPGLPDLAAAPEGEALHAALREFAPMLKVLAERLCGNPADAMDLVQDTFVLAARGIPPGVRNVRAWLTTILHKLFIDGVRAKTRGPIEEHIDGQLDHIAQSESEDPEPDWTRITTADIRSAVEELDPVYREVYLLHTFEQRSYDNIARKLGISRVTVGTRLNRARKRLREVLIARFALDKIP